MPTHKACPDCLGFLKGPRNVFGPGDWDEREAASARISPRYTHLIMFSLAWSVAANLPVEE